MRIFGVEFGRKRVDKAALAPSSWTTILEPFTGAWQRNIVEEAGSVLTYPALYACISRIVSDIGKLPFQLVEKKGEIYEPTLNPAYSPVLKRPNHYQTASQFREAWILSKLVHGNAYLLKQYDQRGVVTDLYVLDPRRVMPMVTETGKVYYQLYTDELNLLPTGADLLVPARDIIHDRCMTVHHPLIGVPPVAAANWPAVKNLKILRSATKFFSNNAQIGGILTAPAGISDSQAEKLRKYWDENYTGDDPGKVAVLGADMKFVSFAMKSVDSQLIEQMRYSDEQICQPFGIKPYKIGINSPPTGWKAYDINTEYYSDALQPHIEHMEALLDDGLRVSAPLGVELDLDPLLRMDDIARAEVESKLVGGKLKTPDEGRRRFNLAPTGGGDTLWGQIQDIPLGRLAERERWDGDPLSTLGVAAKKDGGSMDESKQLLIALERRFAR